MSNEKRTITMPWTPEEFLRMRRDEAGTDPGPIAPGHTWLDGSLVDVRRVVAENAKLREDGDKDYAEMRRLQGIVRKQQDQEFEYQERLRAMHVDNRQMSEQLHEYQGDDTAVELIKALQAELERRTQMTMEQASEAVRLMRGQLRELREAAEVVLQAWADMTDQEMYGEMLRDGMCEPRSDAGETDFDWWAEQHTKLRAVLAKVMP